MKKAALLVLTAPLVLAACGGGSPTAQVTADPVAYVKHAASRTAKTVSEHMALTGKITVSGQGSASLQGSGDFANSPLKGDFSFAFAAPGGVNLKFSEVLAGGAIYVNSPLISRQLPSGKTWAKIDLGALGKANGDSLTQAMSESPAHAFQQLEAVATVTQVGTDTIDGVETTHFRATNLDLSKLGGSGKLQNLAPGSIDVWVGNGNGYVYRETVSLSLSKAGYAATTTMQLDFSKFGEAVHVTVPSASETADLTKQAANGLGR